MKMELCKTCGQLDEVKRNSDLALKDICLQLAQQSSHATMLQCQLDRSKSSLCSVQIALGLSKDHSKSIYNSLCLKHQKVKRAQVMKQKLSEELAQVKSRFSSVEKALHLANSKLAWLTEDFCQRMCSMSTLLDCSDADAARLKQQLSNSCKKIRKLQMQNLQAKRS
jgi:hypothetical protein